MMRDWAGLDPSSSDEADSAGPGDVGLPWSFPSVGSGDLTAGDAAGNDDKRFRPPVSVARPDMGSFPDEPLASLCMPVLAEALCDAIGRPDPARDAGAALAPSCRGMGESRRTERAEAVRGCSEPGTGEGAAEPLAAAVALRTWARTCDACRSVR